MFIDVVPNGRSASAVLLRESYREGRKVRKRTLANLSKLPPPVVEGLRVLLQGGTAIARPEEVFEIQRSLPHGHAAAVIGMMRKLDLPRLLSRTVSRERDLALALIASRIIAPGSKLATARALSPETASSSLGRVLDLGVIEEREIYAALDWLGEQQDRIERSLARRHLKNGALVLYDVSSSYVEGRCCELARHGYSRDHRPDRLQIVYGLLCDRDGRPIAVEVFEGDTGDQHAVRADQQAEAALRSQARGAGRRPRDDHQRPYSRGSSAGRAGLDHHPARAADPGADRKRAAAALAVRRAQSGGDHRA